MNVYPVKIMWKGEEKILSLKLDLKHIRELQVKTGKEILDLITDAPRELGQMGDLLDAALRWKGNENPADLTGDDLFDLLVQQGKAGIADWLEIANGIAAASGVLQSAQANAMLAAVKRRMEKAIEQMNRDEEDEEEEKDTPSPQKESRKK